VNKAFNKDDPTELRKKFSESSSQFEKELMNKAIHNINLVERVISKKYNKKHEIFRWFVNDFKDKGGYLHYNLKTIVDIANSRHIVEDK